MAFYYEEPSRTFSEYLLIPGYSSVECVPSKVSLKTPLVKFEKEEPELSMNIDGFGNHADRSLTTGLQCPGPGRRPVFIYGSQPIESQAGMIEKSQAVPGGVRSVIQCIAGDDASGYARAD